MNDSGKGAVDSLRKHLWQRLIECVSWRSYSGSFWLRFYAFGSQEMFGGRYPKRLYCGTVDFSKKNKKKKTHPLVYAGVLPTHVACINHNALVYLLMQVHYYPRA